MLSISKDSLEEVFIIKKAPYFVWEKLLLFAVILSLLLVGILSFALVYSGGQEEIRKNESFVVESEPEDDTGRTVVYQGRIFNGIGVGRTYTLPLYKGEYAVGKVAYWEGKGDYLVLALLNQDGFGLGKYKISSASQENPTRFLVEDLSKEPESLEELGVLGVNLREADVKYLGQGGSIVAVIFREEDDKFAKAVVYRRYGGKDRLEKELGFKL